MSEHQDSAAIDRRTAIKKAVTGAAVAGVVWSAPKVEGLSLRPNYASAASGATCTMTFTGLMFPGAPAGPTSSNCSPAIPTVAGFLPVSAALVLGAQVLDPNPAITLVSCAVSPVSLFSASPTIAPDGKQCGAVYIGPPAGTPAPSQAFNLTATLNCA